MRYDWDIWFATIYDQEYERLIKTAYRMTGDMELAHDLVQETFLLAIFRRNEFAEHPKPAAWLYLTLRNNILNERRRFVHKEVSLEEVYDIPAKAEESSLDEVLPKELKNDDRKILIWRFEEGKSYSEMSELLGISENACRNRVSRAVARCRNYMKKNFEG